MVDEIAILWCHSEMGWLCFYILMGAGLEGLKEVPCSSNTEAPGPDSQKEWAARRQASFLLCVRLLHLRDRDSLMRLLCSQLDRKSVV